MEFSFTTPWYYSIACLLVGIISAYWLYLKKPGFSADNPMIGRVLFVIRATVITLIAFLLLSPLVKTTEETSQKPILLVAQDASASVGAYFHEKQNADAYMRELAGMVQELSEQYDVRVQSFGQEIREGLQDSFTDQLSHISAVISQWNDVYEYQRVGASVILSDGIYNAGIPPVYQRVKIQAPIYTVALGDTIQYPDLMVQRMLTSDIVFLGDDLLIEAEVRAEKINSPQVDVTLEHKRAGNWQTVSRQRVELGADQFGSLTFKVKADKTGVAEYRAVVQAHENEKQLNNNVKTVYVDVIDARQKVSILALSPHPDIAAMKRWLLDDSRFEVELRYGHEALTVPQDADLVIFHQLPGTTSPVQNLIAQLDKQKKPRLFILGQQTDLQNFNKAQSLVEIDGPGTSFNDVQVLLNRDFTLFTINKESAQSMSQFPPLVSFFGEYNTSANAVAMMSQRISNIETEYPLLLFGEREGIRSGALLGEGIWRWRMYDQLQNKSDELSRDWFSKTIQYLSITEDKTPFKLTPAKRIFEQTEEVVMDARLFNASFEMINEPDIPLSIIDESGNEYEYYFDKTDNRYTLNIGRLPSGTYRYKSSFSWSNSSYNDSGTFTVKTGSLEKENLVADHNTLFQLARDNNGRMYTAGQLESLTKELREASFAKPVYIASSQSLPFITLKWPFFLILILLTLEWVIRRWNGGL